MPLTDVERRICNFTIRRLLDHNGPTSEKALLKEFRGLLADPLRRLLDWSVLKVLDHTNETYLPRAIAFHYCGDAAALALARQSTETVLRVILAFFEQTLEGENKDQKQFTPTDVEVEARKLDSNIDAKMIRLGLYLVEEFGIFGTNRRDEQQLWVASFSPSKRIYEVMESGHPWDDLVRRGSVAVERTWEKQQPVLVPPDEAIFDARNSFIASWKTQNDQEVSRKIFLVHGHAEEVKQTVAAFLRTLDLEVVILHEQPNRGRTIIEKFEKHSDVGFAVVLLTPDDIGAPIEEPDKTKKRARQNVILELGYFTGKLGRGRVCSIYVEDVELPSDLHGVLWVAYDPQGQWRPKLAMEIQAAGISVDFKEAVSQEPSKPGETRSESP